MSQTTLSCKCSCVGDFQKKMMNNKHLNRMHNQHKKVHDHHVVQFQKTFDLIKLHASEDLKTYNNESESKIVIEPEIDFDNTTNIENENDEFFEN
jgi:hypothetical protein